MDAVTEDVVLRKYIDLVTEEVKEIDLTTEDILR